MPIAVIMSDRMNVQGSHWTNLRKIDVGNLYEYLSRISKFGYNWAHCVLLLLAILNNHENALFELNSIRQLGWMRRYKYYANAT